MKNEVLRTNLWLQYVSIVGYFAKYYSEMLTFEVRNLSHYTIGLLMLLRVYCCVDVSTVDFVALRRCMLHCQLLRFVGCLRDLLSRFRIGLRYVMGLLQLRYEHHSSTIRLRFDYDSSAIQHPTRSYVLSSNNEHVNSFPLL